MSELDRNDIQGLLLSAYGHLPWSANVLLRIDDAELARIWIGALASEITVATGRDHDRSMNLALTYAGLRTLGLDAQREAFPFAFVTGMATDRCAAIFCDTGKIPREKWHWGKDGDDVHLLLMLFALCEDALEEKLSAHTMGFAAGGVSEVVPSLRTRRFPNGREHFGFSDGISQPAIARENSSETLRTRNTPANDVEPGEFILGYRNEYGFLSDTIRTVDGEDFGRNGSYLVFQQLEQNVAGFWTFLEAQTGGPAGSDAMRREQLAAKLIGRWPSGAPLVEAPNASDAKLEKANSFGFDTDRQGLRCPIGAHIRRANPRDAFPGDTVAQSVRRSNRHRILRRGRPYGPRIADELKDDGKERGLIFIGLNSDIERQFEFIQQTWLNNPTFCGLANEIDPLAGSHPGGALFTIPRDSVRTRIKNLPNVVTMRGGAYFFLPGLHAICKLAALTSVKPAHVEA